MLLLLFVLFLTIPSPIAKAMTTKTEQSSKWENHIILHSHFPLESLGKMDNSIKEDNGKNVIERSDFSLTFKIDI